MPIQVTDDGRRSVHVSIDVPGAAEDAWRAIATGEGVSAWFVPTTIENDENGAPRTIRSDFGPGMESVATVTGWDPPGTLNATSNDLGPDAPAVATEWAVETNPQGGCTVRVSHRIETDSDEWDKHLVAWEEGWPSFFRILHLYLGHFAGQSAAGVQLAGFHPGPREATWRILLEGVGVNTFVEGKGVATNGAAPSMSGTAEVVGLPDHPEELLLRLDAPAPGVSHIFAMDMGDQVMLSIRFFFYGDDAADHAAHAEADWQTWLGEAIPS